MKYPLIDHRGASVSVCGYVFQWRDRCPLTDGTDERFSVAAFDISPDIHATISHDPNYELARASDGLQVHQDHVGVWCSLPLFAGDAGINAAHMVFSGDAGWSFVFRPIKTERKGDETVIQQAVLEEVCLTRNPSYKAGACWLSYQRDEELSARNRAIRQQWKSCPSKLTSNRQLEREQAARASRAAAKAELQQPSRTSPSSHPPQHMADRVMAVRKGMMLPWMQGRI